MFKFPFLLSLTKVILNTEQEQGSPLGKDIISVLALGFLQSPQGERTFADLTTAIFDAGQGSPEQRRKRVFIYSLLSSAEPRRCARSV
jgi:hypothetical protein